MTYPDAHNAPSLWNSTENTSLECPSCNSSSLDVATSHSRHVVSKLALATYLPDGWKATRATLSLCPFIVDRGVSLRVALSVRMNDARQRGRTS